MANTGKDAEFFYTVQPIKAYQIRDGEETSLTPDGQGYMRLLTVQKPPGIVDPSVDGSEEPDCYLHLQIQDKLDFPMPSTTKIFTRPPASYMIPRWDVDARSGEFLRIEFPPRATQEEWTADVAFWETILEQFHLIGQDDGFVKRSGSSPSLRPPPPPAATSYPADKKKSKKSSSAKIQAYDPSNFTTGEAYVAGSRSSTSQLGGRIVLVDEENDKVIGELSDGFQVFEDGDVKLGGKDEPVEITLPTEGTNKISVHSTTERVEDTMHPAYGRSTIVSSATRASRLLITTSEYVGKLMQNQADSFAQNTKPVENPVKFDPATHANIRRVNTFSTKAAGLSASAVGSISRVAQNIGASVATRKDGKARGYDKDGNPIDSYKPGMINKTLMAFNAVADGVEQAGRNLLTGASSSVTTVVDHRWGPEAGEVSRNIGGGFKNVGLVYIDVTGVSRRAVLKSVAKGMVVGKVKGGGQVIVGENEEPEVVPPAYSSTTDSKKPHDTYGDGASFAGDKKRPL